MKVIRAIQSLQSAKYINKFDKYVVEVCFPNLPKQEYWIKESQMKALMRSLKAESINDLPAYTTKAVVAYAGVDKKENGKEFFVWASGPDKSWMQDKFGPFELENDPDAQEAEAA